MILYKARNKLMKSTVSQSVTSLLIAHHGAGSYLILNTNKNNKTETKQIPFLPVERTFNAKGLVRFF